MTTLLEFLIPDTLYGWLILASECLFLPILVKGYRVRAWEKLWSFVATVRPKKCPNCGEELGF